MQMKLPIDHHEVHTSIINRLIPRDLTVSRLPELVSRLQQICIECKVKSRLSVPRSTHLLELLC